MHILYCRVQSLYSLTQPWSHRDRPRSLWECWYFGQRTKSWSGFWLCWITWYSIVNCVVQWRAKINYPFHKCNADLWSESTYIFLESWLCVCRAVPISSGVIQAPLAQKLPTLYPRRVFWPQKFVNSLFDKDYANEICIACNLVTYSGVLYRFLLE